MDDRRVTGNLADGRQYRATSYMVEIVDADGMVAETIDLSTITGVQRAGLKVTLKPQKGKAHVLSCATIGDAGRLEETVRSGLPPAAPAKGGGFGRLVKWGCLGTLGIVVIVVIIAVATSGGGSKEAPHTAVAGASGAGNAPAGAATGTKEVGTNKGDVHVALAENQSGEIAEARDKKHKITVLKITDAAKSSNEFVQPATGKKFWVVEVQVENTGSAEIHVGTWKLRTSDDFEHDPSFEAGLGEPLSPLQNLTSGAKTQGVVVFEIAADAQPKFLRYDPNMFMKGDLYFDAK